MNRDEARLSWAALRSRAVQLSTIMVKTLRNSVQNPGADPDEQYRLGRSILECLQFRRSLLERRHGPKWREEDQIRKMERLVDSTMARLEKTRWMNPETNSRRGLECASKDLPTVLAVAKTTQGLKFNH